MVKEFKDELNIIKRKCARIHGKLKMVEIMIEICWK